MKGSMSALDVHAVVRELREYSIKIDQIYVYDKKHVVIRLFIRDVGKRYLRIELPGLLYVSQRYPPAPERAQSASLFLRKLLGGAFIDKIEQIGFERTVRFVCTKSGVTRTLVVELFDKGNVLVLEGGDVVRGVLETQEWSARSVRVGAPYVAVQRDVSLLYGDVSAFADSVSADMPVSKALAMHVGLGGEYAQEVCVRLGLSDAVLCGALSVEQWSAVKVCVLALQREYSPTMYGKDAEFSSVFSVTPFVMQAYKDKPHKSFPTFSEGIDEVYGGVRLDADIKEQNKELKQQLTRTQKILQQLDAQEHQLNKTIVECSRAGQLIYDHYTYVERLLARILLLEKSSGDVASVIAKEFPFVVYDGSRRTISVPDDVIEEEK